MDGRQHLEAAISRHGSVSRAATTWGIPYPSLYAVVRGYRGVSRKQASKWAALSSGELIADLLVWIRATRAEKANGARATDRAKATADHG